MSNITNEKYVSLTTFTKDGRPKHTPVWLADLGDGRLGFTTGIESWKVKRIRNTPKVELTPSDARGRVKEGAEAVAGVAEVVTGAEFSQVREAIKAKYGLQVTMIETAGKISSMFGRSPTSNCAVIITLE